jgi:hypothetical protein
MHAWPEPFRELIRRFLLTATAACVLLLRLTSGAQAMVREVPVGVAFAAHCAHPRPFTHTACRVDTRHGEFGPAMTYAALRILAVVTDPSGLTVTALQVRPQCYGAP